eukprot:TRINITY_DN15082_c0_g1_i1.p1 TRINITY_DN15082_c0_g1~~TRINITY_DN15082_c0_g1_i1.p1  ORF type:complete len:206 (+),score=51.69 TRINITY_DN15082_c0_g1_i1:55-672(+)
MQKYLPSFLGYKIHPEIKHLQKIWKQVDINKFKAILQFNAKYLIDNKSTSQEEFESISKGMDPTLAKKIFAGSLLIMRSAIRSKYESKTIIEQLQQEILMPSELANLIGIMVKSAGDKIKNNEVENRHKYPTIEEMDWRVDVTISTGSMSRVLKPSILMQLDLSDGNKTLFQLNLEKFQELRYQVANVLKEMQNIEANPILKLDH